jgi:hypothetical protein
LQLPYPVLRSLSLSSSFWIGFPTMANLGRSCSHWCPSHFEHITPMRMSNIYNFRTFTFIKLASNSTSLCCMVSYPSRLRHSCINFGVIL